MEGAGELVTALAKLDKEWTLANDNRRGRQQGWDWQKLVVKETASTSWHLSHSFFYSFSC